MADDFTIKSLFCAGVVRQQSIELSLDNSFSDPFDCFLRNTVCKTSMYGGDKMKEAKIVGINFRQWIISPKNLDALICLTLYTYDQLHGMTNFARTFDCKVAPWLLPFFLCTAHRFLPIMLLFLLLISDSPFRTRQQSFVILRTGKRVWLRGQLLYLLLISVGYAALVWVLSWVWYLPEISWETTW